jgi:predicted nucleic acid-binding protein
MKYLLDTCVISELVKIRPSKKVIDWIIQNNEENFYISSLTFGEIHKGIEKLSESIRKNTLGFNKHVRILEQLAIYPLLVKKLQKKKINI